MIETPVHLSTLSVIPVLTTTVATIATITMSKPILYYFPYSPPCRVVLTVARMINVDLDLKLIDLKNKEHLKPDFLKINPFHKVPTFFDTDGFVLDESRAICTYLVESRKPDSSLYPKGDLKRRAKIDRWLQYDLGTLAPAIRPVVYDRRMGVGPVESHVNTGKEALQTLDKAFGLESGKYCVGDELSVADVSIFCASNTIVGLKDFQIDDYPNIKKWYDSVLEQIKPYDTEGMIEQVIEMMKKL